MDVGVRPVQVDLGVREAAHTGADGRRGLGPHTGVRDDDDIGRQPVGLAADQPGEVRRAGLLLALDQQLEVDGRRGAAGGGQVGPHPEGVEEDLALVVGGAPGVQPVADHGRLERVGRPAVLTGGGLHVVVPVDEHGRRGRVPGGPLGEDRRQAVRLPHLGHRETGVAQLGGQPLGGAPYVLGPAGVGGHRGDAQPVGEVREEVGLVLVDEGADDAVRGSRHADDFSSPGDPAAAPVPQGGHPGACNVRHPRTRAGSGGRG